MEQSRYIEDLKDIKDIMQRSSRFISLSGISGIIAGTAALIATYLVYRTDILFQLSMGYRLEGVDRSTVMEVVGIALATLVVSIGAGILFTVRKAKRKGEKIWDVQAQRLVINFFIPLAAGGLLCLILLMRGYMGLVVPLTLIFYGLALINASKYTLPEARSLGIAEVVLGLIAASFTGYGLILWAVGFGVLHIVYGTFMHFKYDR